MYSSTKSKILKAAVIGNPITHSLSPKIHKYWLEKYGIKGIYEKIQIPEDELGNFIINLEKYGFSGINITIPHKENVLKYLIKQNNDVKIIGASNVVLVNGNEIEGYNTDHYGFIENIKQGLKKSDNKEEIFKEKNIVVLGAGGASRAIIYGLINQSVDKIYLLNRTKKKAEKIAQDFKKYMSANIDVIDWSERNNIISKADILVNTTSLGMVGQKALDIDLALLKEGAIVTDIVFNPLITPLLQQALDLQKKSDKNYKIIDGLGMLLHQAAPSFKMFFDRENKYIDDLPEVINELRKVVLGK